MSIKVLYIFVMLLPVLFSCAGDTGKLPVNINGGADRDNNYSKLGDFYNKMFSVNDIEMKDKSGAIQLPLVIDNLRIVVATVNGTVAMLRDMRAVWEVSTGGNYVVASGMAADRDINIYFILNNGELRSYSVDGKFRWKYHAEEFKNSSLIFDDLLCVNDGLLVAASSGIIFKVDFNGHRLWSYSHSLRTLGSFCTIEDGSIAFPATNNKFGASDTLHLIGTDGKLKWKKPLQSMRIINNPLSNKDNIFLPASFDLNDQKLYLILAFDKNGNEIWRRELNIMPRNLSCDDEGNIYVQASNSGYGESISGIFCLGAKGEIKWKLYLDINISSQLILGRDVIALLGNRRNAIGVFFINRIDGTFLKSVTLSDAPLFLHKPFVMYDPAICFLGSEKMFLLKIDDTAINKVLPW